MISRLRLLRFKRFADLSLTLSPLTVLTGTNGSGKTSVIHALLLTRQAASSSSDVIQLNGPYGLQLGEATEVLHHEADATEGIVVEVESASVTHSWKFSTEGGRSLVVEILERPSDPPELLVIRDRRFTYLCADRLGPQDALPAASSPPEFMGVGPQGEHVAHVLAALDRHLVPEGRRYPDVNPTTLQHHVEGWMKSVTKPLEIQAEWFPNSTVTRLQYKTPGIRHEWVRPSNMGFGVSTALPILVAGLVAKGGGLLIIENPEIHLHPAGQSAIGVFLAKIAADGVQVLVETHSDHVINGVRRAVAESGLPAEDVVLHYFDNAVTEITVDEQGKLSEWPVGFFDQIDRDLGAIARRQRRR